MNTITHTTKTYGGEVPSMGGVGGFVTVDPVINVRWNDANNTFMRITNVYAEVEHTGETHWLQRTNFEGGMQDALDYWLPRIQRRLEAKRLQDRVRGGLTREEVSERLKAWNARLESDHVA